jgi:hypothetical protein
MKIFKLKKDGKVSHEVKTDKADFKMEIPQGWGYMEEGWRTAQQLLELGLLQEGKPTQEFEVSPEREVILQDGEQVTEYSIYTREVDVPAELDEQGVEIKPATKKIERYYTIPAVKETRFWVEKNYTIEVEDTTAQEQAEATAKAQRLADLQEIKGFIEDINNSDLKPWHKKILKFLVKEQKE